MQVDLLLVHLHSWPLPYGTPTPSVSSPLAPSPGRALHSVFVPSVQGPVRSVPWCQLRATLPDWQLRVDWRSGLPLDALLLPKILAFVLRCGSSLKEALEQIHSILFHFNGCPLPELGLNHLFCHCWGRFSAALLKDDLFHQSVAVENCGFIKNTIYIFIAYFLCPFIIVSMCAFEWNC